MPKKEVQDYSQEVDEGVAKWTSVALEEKRLQEAIDGLLVLEKKCRVGEDSESGKKVAACLVKVCFESKDYESLKSNLLLLSKRRGQLKQVTKAGVQTCADCLDTLSEADKEIKIDLITVLRTITEGKIFVENERARLTKILATIREDEGKIKEASELMQDIQVETYGSMDKREKSEFILEQIRLCLDSQDNIRALILSDKISKKLLADEAFQDIKLSFHKLMIRYHIRKENFTAICRAYLEIFHTKKVQENPAEREGYLKAAAVFCCLSPYDNDQSDLAHRIQTFKEMEDLPSFKSILKDFTTPELIMYDQFNEKYSTEFDKMELLYIDSAPEPLSSSSDDLMASSASGASDSLSSSQESLPLRALVDEKMRKRVIEHNIRTVAQHYSRIRTERLCQLLGLADDETEEYVSTLVASKTIYARIDRWQGIISFQKEKEASEKLNEWSSDVVQLLTSLEKVSHLIQRENMVHKIN